VRNKTFISTWLFFDCDARFSPMKKKTLAKYGESR
jgi:hypothetical protein